MSPLASYRRLLHLAGPSYVVVAFLGRLPLAMSQLGVLLMVATATGSYGLGGLVAGALAIANAVGAPVAGTLADRVGQRPVVLVQSLAGAAGLLAVVGAVHAGADAAVVVAVAAATGLMLPQVGPLARVRWRPITAGAVPPTTQSQQRRLVDAAFSYEGAADEASFALGPALVGLGAVALSPSGSVIGAAIMLAVFGSAFALHRSAALTGHSQPRSGARGRLITPAFAVLGAAQLCIGMLFAATQTGATVLATEAGQPGAAGLVHATLGIGSAVAGIATAYLPERIGHERRALVATAALTVLGLPLLLVDGLLATTLVIGVLGCAVAPYMIAVFSLGERIAAPARVGTAMTLLASATGIGYAAGSALAGRLADSHGATAAFAVTVGATALATLLLATQQGRLRAAQRDTIHIEAHSRVVATA